MKENKRGRYFTDEFKRNAVQLVLEKGVPVRKVALYRHRGIGGKDNEDNRRGRRHFSASNCRDSAECQQCRT